MNAQFQELNYSIYLGFSHPFRSPDEFTAALRRDPDRCWNKGASRTTPDGHMLPGRHKENRWFAEICRENNFEGAGLETIIATQLNAFEPQKNFFQCLLSEGGTSDLSVYWNFHGNTTDDTLSVKIMTRLVEFGLNLDLHDAG